MKRRGIVVQEIKDIIAFRVMGADQEGVDGDMIEDQGIGNHAFAHAKIAGRMLRFERINGHRELLAIAAGMALTINIIGAKQRHCRKGIDDAGTGSLQGLESQVVARGTHQGAGRNIGHFAHAVQAHVRSPGNQTGHDHPVVTLMMRTPQHMVEVVHEQAAWTAAKTWMSEAWGKRS